MTGAGSDPSGLDHHRRARRRRATRPSIARGVLSPARQTWELDWWIGADDRWHVPAREAAVRQQLSTACRWCRPRCGCPAATRCSACTARPPATSVRSRSSRSPTSRRRRSSPPSWCAVRARSTSTGPPSAPTGASAIRTPRPPSRWAASVDGSTEDTVTSGAASDGPFAHRQDRGARLVAAFLYPVAHRTTLARRREHGHAGDRRGRSRRAARRRRRWRAGGRPSSTAACGSSCPTSRCSARSTPPGPRRCWPGQAWRVDPDVAAVLEDWGLDAEAAVAWSRLTGRARRTARAAGSPAARRGSRSLARAARPDAAAARARCEPCSCASTTPASHCSPTGRASGSASRSTCATPRPGAGRCRVRCGGTANDRRCCGKVRRTRRFTAPGLDPTWSSSEARGEALLARVRLRGRG